MSVIFRYIGEQVKLKKALKMMPSEFDYDVFILVRVPEIEDLVRRHRVPASAITHYLYSVALGVRWLPDSYYAREVLGKRGYSRTMEAVLRLQPYKAYITVEVDETWYDLGSKIEIPSRNPLFTGIKKPDTSIASTLLVGSFIDEVLGLGDKTLKKLLAHTSISLTNYTIREGTIRQANLEKEEARTLVGEHKPAQLSPKLDTTTLEIDVEEEDIVDTINIPIDSFTLNEPLFTSNEREEILNKLNNEVEGYKKEYEERVKTLLDILDTLLKPYLDYSPRLKKTVLEAVVESLTSLADNHAEFGELKFEPYEKQYVFNILLHVAEKVFDVPREYIIENHAHLVEIARSKKGEVVMPRYTEAGDKEELFKETLAKSYLFLIGYPVVVQVGNAGRLVPLPYTFFDKEYLLKHTTKSVEYYGGEDKPYIVGMDYTYLFTRTINKLLYKYYEVFVKGRGDLSLVDIVHPQLYLVGEVFGDGHIHWYFGDDYAKTYNKYYKKLRKHEKKLYDPDYARWFHNKPLKDFLRKAHVLRAFSVIRILNPLVFRRLRENTGKLLDYLLSEVKRKLTSPEPGLDEDLDIVDYVARIEGLFKDIIIRGHVPQQQP